MYLSVLLAPLGKGRLVWTRCVRRPLPQQPPGPGRAAQCTAAPPGCLCGRRLPASAPGGPAGSPLHALGRLWVARGHCTGSLAQGSKPMVGPWEVPLAVMPPRDTQRPSPQVSQQQGKSTNIQMTGHSCLVSDKPATVFNSVIKEFPFAVTSSLQISPGSLGRWAMDSQVGECGQQSSITDVVSHRHTAWWSSLSHCPTSPHP